MIKSKIILIMKRKIIVLLSLITLLPGSHVSAQSFLKKLAKGIESTTQSIDKALGTDSEKTQQASSSSSSGKVSKGTNTIVPFTSNNTKVIYMNNAKRFKFDYTDFSDGVAFVKDADKKRWATIDTNGNFLTDFVFNFDQLSFGREPSPYYNSGVCITTSLVYPYTDPKKLHNALIIDKKGKVVQAIPNISSYTNFSDSIAHIRIYLPDPKKTSSLRTEYYYKYMYINTKGENSYPHLTVDIYPTNDGRDIPSVAPIRKISEGLRAYWSYKTGWGFIDKEGEVAIKPAFRNVHDFKDGYAAVEDWNKNWGFIDKTGQLVIPHRYSNEPSDFQEGLSIVRKRDGSDCYIDTSGNVVLDNINDKTINNLGPFYNGKAFVTCYIGSHDGMAIGVGTVVLNRDLKSYKVLYPDPNINGKKLIDYRNGKYYFQDGSIVNGSFQVIRYNEDGYNGNTLPFHDGLAKFQYRPNDDIPYGYIAENGEIKILFKEPEF